MYIRKGGIRIPHVYAAPGNLLEVARPVNFQFIVARKIQDCPVPFYGIGIPGVAPAKEREISVKDKVLPRVPALLFSGHAFVYAVCPVNFLSGLHGIIILPVTVAVMKIIERLFCCGAEILFILRRKLVMLQGTGIVLQQKICIGHVQVQVAFISRVRSLIICRKGFFKNGDTLLPEVFGEQPVSRIGKHFAA